jgi:S1-C subfamily serine protease
VGPDVGFRKRQGEETKERVVKVYVSRKIDASFLPEEQRIPTTLRFDGRDVGVDVEQRGIPRTLAFTLRDRPLRGGMSISTIDDDLGGTGTLGICVTLNDGNTYILSNNHVIAGSNTAPLGIPILQPAEGDGGASPADIVKEDHQRRIESRLRVVRRTEIVEIADHDKPVGGGGSFATQEPKASALSKPSPYQPVNDAINGKVIGRISVCLAIGT